MGYGSGPYGSGPYGSGSGVLTFTPPTYERTIPRTTTRGPRYHLDQGVSVVRVSGVLRIIRTPTPAQLEAAGAEGVDWFIGGHRYVVSEETWAELELGGFV